MEIEYEEAVLVTQAIDLLRKVGQRRYDKLCVELSEETKREAAVGLPTGQSSEAKKIMSELSRMHTALTRLSMFEFLS